MSQVEPILERPQQKRQNQPTTEHQVRPCNFRYAGRLSSDNARALSTLFEQFATNTSNALEAYLGASFLLKLSSMEQSTVQEYLGVIPLDSYLVPCALDVMDAHLLIQMDIPLALPIIDLLLGGAGAALPSARVLTDLDEEILGSVSALFVREIQRIWHPLNLSYRILPCVRAAAVPLLFAANEKVVVLLFELSVGNISGNFRYVLPTSFVGYLVRHLNTSQSLLNTGQHESRTPTLRHRILNGQFALCADITRMRVLVRDLAQLKPGQIIRLRAPVRDAGHLTIEGHEIFRATPVRSGPQKAAQVLSQPGATQQNNP